MTAHNRHAGPFISVFLSKTRREGRGTSILEKEQEQFHVSPRLPWREKAARAGRRQKSKRGAAAPSSGRVQHRPCFAKGGDPAREAEEQALPSLGPRQDAVTGRGCWQSILQLLLLLNWEADLPIILALVPAPAHTRKQMVHHTRFPSGNTAAPILSPWSVSGTGLLET